MKHITLKEITAACGGTYFGDESSRSKRSLKRGDRQPKG